jgi:hypothetical protein
MTDMIQEYRDGADLCQAPRALSQNRTPWMTTALRWIALKIAAQGTRRWSWMARLTLSVVSSVETTVVPARTADKSGMRRSDESMAYTALTIVWFSSFLGLLWGSTNLWQMIPFVPKPLIQTIALTWALAGSVFAVQVFFWIRQLRRRHAEAAHFRDRYYLSFPSYCEGGLARLPMEPAGTRIILALTLSAPLAVAATVTVRQPWMDLASPVVFGALALIGSFALYRPLRRSRSEKRWKISKVLRRLKSSGLTLRDSRLLLRLIAHAETEKRDIFHSVLTCALTSEGIVNNKPDLAAIVESFVQDDCPKMVRGHREAALDLARKLRESEKRKVA